MFSVDLPYYDNIERDLGCRILLFPVHLTRGRHDSLLQFEDGSAVKRPKLTSPYEPLLRIEVI